MKVGICGLREPDNICAVSSLGVDMIGFDFCKNSSRYVSLLPSFSGTLPDYVERNMSDACSSGASIVDKVGIFADDMPQNIITMAYNYRLDYIQFDGVESAVMMDNLRSTLNPDICPGIKFIKTIRIGCADDLRQCDEYISSADVLLFDVAKIINSGCFQQELLLILSGYDAQLPFMLKGRFTTADALMLKSINHPMFLGISLDGSFELSPAVIDVESLKNFLSVIEH